MPEVVGFRQPGCGHPTSLLQEVREATGCRRVCSQPEEEQHRQDKVNPDERNGRLEARARPLPGTVVPARPQPAVLILIRSMKPLHGPIATSKGVRLFSTDALRYRDCANWPA